MARPRHGDSLVDNQKTVLIALMRAQMDGAGRVWLGDIRDKIAELAQAQMHDATINRALNEFASRAWVTAAWAAKDPHDHASSRPRLYFELTSTGREAAQQLVDAERARIAPWVLDPTLVGLKPNVPFGSPPRTRRATRTFVESGSTQPPGHVTFGAPPKSNL